MANIKNIITDKQERISRIKTVGCKMIFIVQSWIKEQLNKPGAPILW